MERFAKNRFGRQMVGIERAWCVDVLAFACLSEQPILWPLLQWKCHRISVQLLQHIEKSLEGGSVVILVGAEDAGKALLAVEWDPRELAAVVVQKARCQANTAAGCHIGQCGVVVRAVEIAHLPGGDQPVLDRLQRGG